MEGLIAVREKIREEYAARSRVFDKSIQFILAFATFFIINKNVGYMELAASPVASFALAVICTFFPMIITVFAAAGLILLHMFSASLGMLAVTGMIFLIMFVFYLRLTPKMAMVVLLTPIAFALKIPYLIPVVYALISGPVTMVAVGMGTVVYYMMLYVKKAVPGFEAEDAPGLLGQITAYVKQVFQNKEMWVVIVAFVICYLLVYTLRKQSFDHAWKIAIAAGVVVNVVVIAVGNIVLGGHVSYVTLFAGSVAAIIIGLILELFFFSVDYTKSENLQFEDDEYYYYVKAVPKLNVPTKEKTIKTINEREEKEVVEPAEVKRHPRKEGEAPKKKRPPQQQEAQKRAKKRPEARKAPSAKRHDIDEVNKLLLTQSLRQDLNIRE